MTEETRTEMIRSLLAERRGYEARGLEKRVAEVNAELTRLGHDALPPAKRAQTRVKRGTTR